MTAGDPYGLNDNKTVQFMVMLFGEEYRERILMTVRNLMESVREEGREEGRKEGLDEGLKEGQQKTLLRQLQMRFGALPDAALARLKAADSAELDLVTERILTAPTLEYVLGLG